MRTALDALIALSLLALAWFIMSLVSRTYSAELRRIRDAHATHAHAHDATLAHDDALGVVVIGEYDDYDTLPYADDAHDAPTHYSPTTHAHDTTRRDTRDDYDTIPYYMM